MLSPILQGVRPAGEDIGQRKLPFVLSMTYLKIATKICRWPRRIKSGSQLANPCDPLYNPPQI
jgi:hypothetical protein